MFPLASRSAVFAFLLAAGGLCTAAATPATATKVENDNSRWVFRVLPKAFQKNPRVDLAVITEMTEAGKKVAPPTAEKPTYYFAQSAGFHEEGHGDGTPVSTPATHKFMEKQVEAALADSHFIHATAEHPATIALFYFWGVHSRLNENVDDVGFRNLLSRAKLVGGDKFARELERAIHSSVVSDGMLFGIADPVYQFREQDDLHRELMSEILDDCYFVVVSAYDGAALARGERRLLWRTKMSTSAQGVSLDETLPALVLGGTQFFGRDMGEAQVVAKIIHRTGRVDIGEPKVKDYFENPAAAEKK